MGAALSPEKVLRDLAALWTSMAKQQSHDREAAGEPSAADGVLRACTMTLVVLAEESEDPTALGETIAALMPEHPARAILLRLHPDGPRALSERVYAQCWMPFGQRRQVCCEQVEITASDAALGDLPPLVLPLTVSDLPVILWCRAPRLTGMLEFGAMAGIATRVVVDSSAMPDAARALRLLQDLARNTPVGDLAWTGLTRWRAMLSQVFENRERLARIAGVARLRVAFSGTYETAARYLAAWISDGLRAAGAKPQVTVEPDAQVSTVRVELEGRGLRLALWRDGQRLMAQVDDSSQCTHLPPPGDYILMREELGIDGRDPVFEAALAEAAGLG